MGSSTGRNLPGSERDPDDFYPTPSWAVDVLLDALPTFRPTLEPGAGDGALVVACLRRGIPIRGLEIDHKRAAEAAANTDGAVFQGDALDLNWTDHVILANPPFSLAVRWVAKTVEEARGGYILLRLDFHGTEKRRSMWDRYRHKVRAQLNLSMRPKFRPGGNDSAEYAWFGFGDVPVPPRAVPVMIDWLYPGDPDAQGSLFTRPAQPEEVLP